MALAPEAAISTTFPSVSASSSRLLLFPPLSGMSRPGILFARQLIMQSLCRTFIGQQKCRISDKNDGF
jgi:hypothetical protein